MPAPQKNAEPTHQFNVRLTPDHWLMLNRIADSIGEGSKNRAVGILIDLYGGKILERAEQESDIRKLGAPVEVTRWKTPRLNEELIGYMAGLVRAGNMPEIAYQLAGVPTRLRKMWEKQGRADRNAGKQTLAADLVAALERAEAECEAEDIARLRRHGQQTWTALAWRLERQYPDRYAQRKRIDGKVQHSMIPMVDWDRLTPLETRTLVELLRKASPELDEPGVSRSARPAFELVPGDVLEVIDVDAAEVSDVPAPEEKPEP